MAYLDPNHPDAFLDWPIMEPTKVYTKPCPRCLGHGGWNLQLNAYKLYQKEDTPENRHLYSHFRAGCNHCNGWGYVSPLETCIGHEWKYEAKLGHCFNRYRCVHCDITHDVDSSD